MSTVRRIMRAFKMNEISAVDSPAQAHARMVLMKRHYPESVEKDLYTVGGFGSLLQSLAYMVRSTAQERSYEGDDSKIPEQLQEWLKTGSKIYRDMSREELAELIESAVTKSIDADSEDDAHFATIGKRDFSAAQRRKDADSGVAMKDGSFPIANESDLRNAERLAGKAKNPSAARAHIRSRAAALGLKTNMSKSISAEIIESLAGTTPDEREAVAKAVSGDAQNAGEKIMTEAEIAALQKRASDAEAAIVAVAKMSESHRAHYLTLEGDAKGAFLAKSEGEREAVVVAKNTVLPEVAKAMDDLAKARASFDAEIAKRDADIAKLKAKDDAASFEKRALDLGLPKTAGETMQKAYSGDVDAQKKLDSLIKGLVAQADTVKLFSEFGTGNGGDALTAKVEMAKAVDAYKTAQEAIGKKISKEQAFTAVYTSRDNLELKKRYDAEEALAKSHRAA